MSDLVIEKVDEVNVRVRCERSLAKELSDFFTFKVPGHKYMPAYRSKVWDGTVKLYNMFSQEIYTGLLDYVISFAKEREYSYQLTLDIPNNKADELLVRRYMENNLKISVKNKLISPHDHQVNAITHAIRKERCLLLSPTGSGKSLIIYTLMRHYLEKTNKKILVIVPTTGLVTQMYSDFSDYSGVNEWNVEENVHKI